MQNISISMSASYEEGSGELEAEAIKAMKAVAAALRKKGLTVHGSVYGREHTDL